jgi:hypothetical protein
LDQALQAALLLDESLAAAAASQVPAYLQVRLAREFVVDECIRPFPHFATRDSAYRNDLHLAGALSCLHYFQCDQLCTIEIRPPARIIPTTPKPELIQGPHAVNGTDQAPIPRGNGY